MNLEKQKVALVIDLTLMASNSQIGVKVFKKKINTATYQINTVREVAIKHGMLDPRGLNKAYRDVVDDFIENMEIRQFLDNEQIKVYIEDFDFLSIH